MITHIIQKELRENLLNLRFIIACIITVVLIVVTILTLANTYTADIRDYNDRQKVQEDFISHYGHLNRVGWMARPLRPPDRYSFLVTGIDREANQENFLSNPMPVLFSQTDLVTVVTIIMSLMAILFSYNSISGEREMGMLKQMLSSNISRSTIIFGKFIGGVISLLVPFILGLLSGILVISINPDIILQRTDLVIFLMLLIVSILYISAFYALGLYFSARSRSSNVSVLKSLFAWVVLVLMLPNISPFLAARFYHLPSKTKIDMETWTITSEERDTIVNRKTNELLRGEYRDIADKIKNSSFSGNDTSLQRKFKNDPVLKERYSQFHKNWMSMVTQVNLDQQAKVSTLQKDFEERSKFQEKIATVVACISPLANYDLAATDLADAGIGADDHWQEEVNNYHNAMDPILMSIYNKAIKNNPQLSVNDFIDLHDLPRFQHQSVGSYEKITMVLPYIGMLIFYNLLFIIGAWISFLKYDVR